MKIDDLICDGIHMAILDILHFPDPRLRTIAQPVTEVDAAVRQLVDNMFDTMYSAPGIGLAATQVNVSKRIVVIDISEDNDQPLCLINPEILALSGVEEMEEGCLSVPGIYETVQRADQVRMRALDRDGRPFELETGGLLAVVRGELPKPLGEHCLSAVLDGATLALSTDSPVWSAKLRFHTPRLLSQLRKAHPGIANIRIRVAGNRLARATPTRRPPRGGHSDLAASIVARAASDTSDSTLRQALQRLAKAMREN